MGWELTGAAASPLTERSVEACMAQREGGFAGNARRFP